jgi:hypothetical protein
MRSNTWFRSFQDVETFKRGPHPQGADASGLIGKGYS